MLKKNVLTSVKKRENTYIMNIDGSYLYKAFHEGRNYTTEGFVDKAKLYSATIPYSLEMIRLDGIYDKEIRTRENKSQFTESIVNVTFEKEYHIYNEYVDEETGEVKISKEKVANKKEIRRHLYVNGFTIEDAEYVFYKRGAAKARTGSCLFIKKDMFKPLMDRSRLLHNGIGGLYIEKNEECDMTSLHAYQSLILSGLEDIITIPKSSILIVSDINSKPFTVTSSVTHQKGGKLVTEDMVVERINNMTDGEGLIDESIFIEAGREKRGMMLLRNDFFKCCGLNTNIQGFFKKRFGDEYKTKILKDLYGNEVLAKDVRMIVTPSSVKYLKFAYKFKDKKECYNDWLNNIDDTFGIVKSDKAGNYGNWNRLTYQIINSMPFDRADIKELIKEEFNYVNKLKNDTAFFMNHININDSYLTTLSKDLDISRVAEEDDDIYESKKYNTSDFISNALAVNKNFQYTPIFKDWKQKQIYAYVKELRKGKIRLEDTLYGTIFANPYELLLHSIGEFEGNCIATGTEIYCPYYICGETLATFRNPHINAGNVMVSHNEWRDEYKWFNLTDNIILINVSDNDFPDRGQGFDYDSDCLLLTNNKNVVKRAIECLKYLTPLNMVKGDSKVRYNNMEELAALDTALSNNFIGKIINKSQIIGSYMWNLSIRGADGRIVKKLFDTTSQLSSLSQIELDKAKKSFDNISMSKELKRINNIKFEDKNVIEFEIIDNCKKMVVPKFFEAIADNNTYRKTVEFETPMDYLQAALDELGRPNRTKRMDLKDLTVKAKDLVGGDNNSKQHEDIFEIISKCSKRINSCMLDGCVLNTKGKQTVKRKAKEEAIEELSKMKINQKTIFAIINKCFKKSEENKRWTKNAMLTLNLLYKYNALGVLGIFKEDEYNERLTLDDNGDICIFGDMYKRV